MISIVDYGLGNLGSIVNMFKRLGVKTELVSTVDGVQKAKKILLPGVGAFDAAIELIDRTGLRQVLDEKALVEKVPILGICLGMQLLTESSEEGSLPGLGWVPAKTKSFKGRVDSRDYKIPHMGWSSSRVCSQSELTQGFSNLDDLRFYFVHSYFVECSHVEHSILKTEYGVEFDSAIQKDNIFGAQFHPEKSHKYGMKLLENFAKV